MLFKFVCKRLLRNRVSAQQARERKKAYLQNLERNAKMQEMRTSELEHKNKSLEMEVATLRALLKSYMANGSDQGDEGSVENVIQEVVATVTEKMREWYVKNKDDNEQNDISDDENVNDEEDDYISEDDGDVDGDE